MAFDTFDEFVKFTLLPHIVVYYLYMVVKYIPIISSRIRNVNSLTQPFSIFCLLTCGCFCHCCCNCCGSASNLLKKVVEYNLKFDRWLIKLLLGREEGVVERHHDDYQPDEDSEGRPFAPIYIRNKSLSYAEVGILITLTLTFGLLIGITAFDVFFLDVSHVCTDDKRFSCFVVPFEAHANKSELGITNQRINNCSQWEHTNISDQVYVICYKWVYNLKGVTIVIGALISLFQLAVKAIISIFISICAYLRNNDRCTCTKRILKYIRRICSIIAFIIEVMIFSFIVLLTIYYFNGRVYGTVVRFMTEHGNQVLLIFGIITTCLWLPIEDYIQDTNQQNLLIINQVPENGRNQTNYSSTA